MSKPLTEWTVLPHGPLTRLDDNLLTVEGVLRMPLGQYPRRMTVARLRDARLVIYSAIALSEPEMAALERFGTPAFLIVPGDLHRLDAGVWKQRYPDLFVCAPEGSRAKVEEVVRVDATHVDFEDPDVQFITVRGTEGHEAALLVHSAGGATLVVNDLIWNLEGTPGFGGWVMDVAGFTGDEPHIPPLVELKLVKEKSALRAQLEEWARVEDLERIIVSHGDVVTRDARSILQQLAGALAA